jgi:SSS family solute:Na+ symporter
MSWAQSHMLEIMMTTLLLGVAAYTILGGMLSVLVTDFLQFVVMSLGLLAVTIWILYLIGWEDLVTAVQREHGAGGFNPVVHEKMGWDYLIFFALLQLAVVITWQTTVQRVLAAKDSATAGRIYTRTSFFFVCRFLIPVIWGIAALAYLTPEQVGDNSLHAMPMLLAAIVPVGLMGLLVAAMLAADMSTDSAYMLTWTSVIYNDILAPFRKRPWSERRGLRWNRSIVALIGVFLLMYGLWYPLKGNLWDYLAVTGTVYLSSMSTLLIACCYWRRANSWGAAGAIFFGAVFPIGFLVMQQVDATEAFTEWVGPHRSGIMAYVFAALAMVIGSLMKPTYTKTEAES